MSGCFFLKHGVDFSLIPTQFRHSEIGYPDLSVNSRRLCFPCCWCKGAERPAKRCDTSSVAGGVQEQAQDVLVPPLLRNCLTPNDTFFAQ